MFIPPPVLLLIAVALSYFISAQFPILQFTDITISLIGMICISLGLTLCLWAVSHLRKHKTTLHPRGKPRKLVTYGPYRVSRNPIYLGFLMVSVGTVLLFANVLAFVGPLLFFGYVSMFIIPVEESILKKGFGASYKAYTKVIRRWL